jgi:formate hydrogenlyase subunit 4
MKLHWSITHIALALTLSPLLLGVINRVKAFFGGRKGSRLFQTYYDIFKLLRKGSVYSRTTSWVFRAGPSIGLASMLAALTLTPLGTTRALISFPGDVILLAYLLGLARFATVIAALDTGSSFEGMGASREVQFSVLAELAFLLGMVALAILGKSFSLSQFYGGSGINELPHMSAVVHLLVAAAFLIVLLTENARIPIDDPNTHLELTMVHEVMVLDHSGVDLGIIQIGSCLKLWIFGALFVGAALPVNTAHPGVNLLLSFIGLFILAILIGVIESSMARLRLLRVPQLLVTSCILSLLALIAAVRL